jgi:hypothetical protein
MRGWKASLQADDMERERVVSGAYLYIEGVREALLKFFLRYGIKFS